MKTKNEKNGNEVKPKVLNTKQRIFVNEMIKHGDMQLAYHKAYPRTSGDALETSSCRLNSQPHIKTMIAEARMRIQKETEENLVAALKEELEAIKTIRETLATIVAGTMKFEKHYKLNDDIKPIDIKAGPREVIQALQLCFKIAKELPVLHTAKDRHFNIAGRPFN